MANKRFRKSQLIAFDNAAAGHDGVLSDPAGEMIVKPCKQSEIDFYESTPAHPAILPFIPTYMGRLSLGSGSAHAAGALILPGEVVPDEAARPHTATATLPVVEHAWAPSGGGKIETDLAIVLENVAADYKKPNILDVKLGARLWADDAPVEKRARLDKAAEETTSKPLGFRIAGMKVYNGRIEDEASGPTSLAPPQLSQGYRVFDKNYGRSFSKDTVHRAFEDFFLISPDEQLPRPVRKVIRRFIVDLEAISEAMALEESKMYSASLLFVYEGDMAALTEAFQREPAAIAEIQQQDHAECHVTSNNPSLAAVGTSGDGHLAPFETDDLEDPRAKLPRIQSLKLIDFAHAKWTPGLGPDENLLTGVRNVTQQLQDLVR